MPRSDRPFTLCETISGVFAEICDDYAIDNHWLSWQFEREIWAGKPSPLRVDTNDLVQKRPMKEGVSKVVFEIDFDGENPNTIKWIRFNELPSKKHYIVTQTSIDHVREDTKCALWIELPPSARKEDIQAVQALLKVEVCCTEWKDSLPKEPCTALERAHLVVATEDEFWLKKQVIHKDMATRFMSMALEVKIAEMDELKKEVERLQRELDDKKNTSQAVKTPSPPRKKARKLATPKTQTPKTQTPNTQTPARKLLLNTAPAKTHSYETRHLVPAMTPTRRPLATKGAFDVDDNDDDDDDAIRYDS